MTVVGGEPVGNRIAGYRVIAVSTGCILSNRAEGNRDTLLQPADIGKMPLPQIDLLIRRVARYIQYIDTARIPDADDRLGILGKVERSTSGVGVEAIANNEKSRVSKCGPHI